jgi:hypothetical protein
MSETHQSPDPIPIRPRLHRQSPSMRELRTKKTRTTGSKNVPPRLLTNTRHVVDGPTRTSRHEHRASRISSPLPASKDIRERHCPSQGRTHESQCEVHGRIKGALRSPFAPNLYDDCYRHHVKTSNNWESALEPRLVHGSLGAFV